MCARPPHIHRREDETFYIREGECRLLLGDEWITAGVGDFIKVPRGTVHRFHNQGTETTRMILTFTPAGIEHFFQETPQPTLDPTADIPDNLDAVAARLRRGRAPLRDPVPHRVATSRATVHTVMPLKPLTRADVPVRDPATVRKWPVRAGSLRSGT